MRRSFPGYYAPTKEEFLELWTKCIFAFDTSVLLDLYRSTANTRNVLLGILDKIRDRIWISYQAAWEYQEKRLGVIAKERIVHTELQESLTTLSNSFKQKMQNHAIEHAEKITAELERSTEKIRKIIEQGANEHPDLIKGDHVREHITKLFEGRVGARYDDKRLGDIYAAGVKRYEQKIPPGYEDAKKGGTRQFGDLIIWNEMLDHAKAEKRPLIFVTNDSKEDWWWKQDQFTMGPRAELVQEMMAYAGQRFRMYNLERFLGEAEKNLDTKVDTGEVRKAAEEFKGIQKKREIQASPPSSSDELMQGMVKTLIDIPRTVDLAELSSRLLTQSASTWRQVPVKDLFHAVEALLSRRLDAKDAARFLNLLLEDTTVGEWAKSRGSCWDLMVDVASHVRNSQ